jgi:hypothetical protein
VEHADRVSTKIIQKDFLPGFRLVWQLGEWERFKRLVQHHKIADFANGRGNLHCLLAARGEVEVII